MQLQPSYLIDELSQTLQQRIMFLDGAMGSMIQTFHLEENDFRGHRFIQHPTSVKGNNDLLVLTQPQLIEKIHLDYLESGADIIQTNTFSANKISQNEYGLSNLVNEINHAAVLLAKNACKTIMNKYPGRKCYVAGSIGPTNATLSISPDVHNPAFRSYTFDQIKDIYVEQITALVNAGVDILLAETSFDTLNLKACIAAIKHVEYLNNIKYPLFLSVTFSDLSGRTLSGQTIDAFYYSIEHAQALAVGLNCGLGAKDLTNQIATLSEICSCFISCYPNAGLPNPLSATGYDETPAITANYLEIIAKNIGLNIVGGCCGTTPEHIKAIVTKIKGISPRPLPKLTNALHLSGLNTLTINNYSASDKQFYIVGERTNVTGSPTFAKHIQANNYPAALEIARSQVNNGANILDINFDEGMLDSLQCMQHFLNLIATEPDICKIPIMLDSSKFEVLEAGLKCVQGKAVVNSISLKEGETEFIRQAKTIKDYGAAVVVMAFDENGQAVTLEDKIKICCRAYSILTTVVNFNPSDIIFDSNILTIATGIEEHNNYAINFIQAIGLIKEKCPQTLVSGGVSNLSFAFRGNNHVREALHSVFLYHAIKAGMDMAIINAGMLTIYDEIEPELKAACEAVIFNSDSKATENLINLASSFKKENKEDKIAAAKWRELVIEEKINYALINGIEQFIDVDTQELLNIYSSPLAVIEKPLMNGMKEVGKLFGEGKMFLPQVVKSARVMKKAVAYLQPFMLEAENSKQQTQKPVFVIATVKGDVHDIGKNIVALVLRCNGYEVIDLGVMVSCDKIIQCAIDNNAAFIGLSGLITPSLEEMIHNVKQFELANIRIPILIGGATTSKLHTAVKIFPHYKYGVVHINDASLVAESCANLLSANKGEYLDKIAKQYTQLSEDFNKVQTEKTLKPYTQAKENYFKADFSKIDQPNKLGVFEIVIDLNIVKNYIDWSPLFWAWGFKGLYPKILTTSEYKDECKKIYTDATQLLDQLLTGNYTFDAKAVVGWWRANSDGDDVIIYDNNNTAIEKFCFLRQQGQLPINFCISDFISPKAQGDYIGAFIVTMGHNIEKTIKDFEANGDDYLAIMTKVLADRLVEAMAEYVHLIMRQSCGIKENLTIDDLIREKYQGVRPAPGYAACPDHTEKSKIWQLLDGQNLTGASLTENYAMYPPSTVAGYYFTNPKAKYFAVGKINKDQVESYATRKKMSVTEVEKWLAPNLAYN
ncbi:MAG: hypothetical protein RL017_875 [Pseudomonadota bacterium]